MGHDTSRNVNIDVTSDRTVGVSQSDVSIISHEARGMAVSVMSHVMRRSGRPESETC
jgi:hypothetical protein